MPRLLVTVPLENDSCKNTGDVPSENGTVIGVTLYVQIKIGLSLILHEEEETNIYFQVLLNLIIHLSIYSLLLSS